MPPTLLSPEQKASAELTKWQALDCIDIGTLTFGGNLENQTAFPCLFMVFKAYGFVPHSNADCERDFSVLARLMTDLRKGKLWRETVERRMKLLLNPDLWNPLPERWGDMRITKLLKEVQLGN